MYNLSKLSPTTNNFLVTLRTGSKDLNQQVALALANAVAFKLPLPSMPVENVVAFFDTTCSGDAMTKIGEVNEMIIVDTKLCVEYTRAIWTARYRTLFPNGKVFLMNNDAVSSFFGFGNCVSMEMIEGIKRNPMVLFNMANGFDQLLEEIAPQPAETETPITSATSAATALA